MSAALAASQTAGSADCAVYTPLAPLQLHLLHLRQKNHLLRMPPVAWPTSRPYRGTQIFDAGPLPPTIASRPDQNRPKPDLHSPSNPYGLQTYPQAVRSFREFGARRDRKRRFRRKVGQQPQRETTAPQRLLRAPAEAERILTAGRMTEDRGSERTAGQDSLREHTTKRWLLRGIEARRERFIRLLLTFRRFEGRRPPLGTTIQYRQHLRSGATVGATWSFQVSLGR